MSSLSHLPYSQRRPAHPVARHLFQIAAEKQTNIVVSADYTDSKSLIECADRLGPYIAVFKTHCDLVGDWTSQTWQTLKDLSKRHGFLIFEDRKLVDIGHTVQRQYHNDSPTVGGGAPGGLAISHWADIVNYSPLGGQGIAQALDQVVTAPDFAYADRRAFLVLAEMTSAGALAKGEYTDFCVKIAKEYPRSTIGFVATRALGGGVEDGSEKGKHGQRFESEQVQREGETSEDMVVFTTGISMGKRGDALGQQYQTPEEAISRGADFLIAGRGIYGADDPIAAVKEYRQAGWDAYLKRVGGAPDSSI